MAPVICLWEVSMKGLKRYRFAFVWEQKVQLSIICSVFLFLLFSSEAKTTFACWPPLRDVQAWVDGNYVYYQVYDPERGRLCTDHSSVYAYSSNLTNIDGVVAWVDSPYGNVNFTVYDPERGRWCTDHSSVYAYSSGLSVTNGTVTWIDLNHNHQTRGYDPSSGSWYSGPTKPLAYFSASTISGNPPLWVWFTDMSIGATSWSWIFGDGSSSGERSTYHIYNSYGAFTATQSVSGPAGNQSKSVTITTDSTAPSGSITINSGSAYTNATSVTLNVSATDNSGSVASMRFSNDNASWSGWESYSTSKSWTLNSGDGERTVYAQFKDAAGNTSSSTSVVSQ